MWRQNSRSVFRPGCPTDQLGKANVNLVNRMTTVFALLLAKDTVKKFIIKEELSKGVREVCGLQ
jgi:hypothetical protein